MKALGRIRQPLAGDVVRANDDRDRPRGARRSRLRLAAWPSFTLRRLPADRRPAAGDRDARRERSPRATATRRCSARPAPARRRRWPGSIEKIGKPALVIAHNKTLAAQLCNEFREFFPDNAVEYFVSYYDYYQPEAYVPQADLYIEKDSSQNDDIARLRLAATSALLTRRDVVIVASVSCIYGLGSPEEWRERVLILERRRGARPRRDAAQADRRASTCATTRCSAAAASGSSGDVVEVQPANAETAYRVSFFGDEVEPITHFDPLTGEVYAQLDNLVICPGDGVRHLDADDRARASTRSARELAEQVRAVRGAGEDARGAPASGSAPSTTSR